MGRWPVSGSGEGEQPSAAALAGVLAIDLGGTDAKLLRFDEAGVPTSLDPAWVVPPSAWAAPERWATEVSALVNAAITAAPGPVRALGLSFPDRCDGQRITGGLTSKTAGLRSARPHDWKAAFDEHVGPLLAHLTAPLRCPGVVVNDGVAAAAALAGLVPGPALVLSLGTSLAAGWLDPEGAACDEPEYASALRIAPPDASPPHSVTGEGGTAQLGATQAGLLWRAGHLAPGLPPREAVRVLLGRAEEPALAAVFDALGADLAATARVALRTLPAPTVRVVVLGRLVRESTRILEVARGCAPELQWFGPDTLRLPAGLSPAHWGQAWGVARLAAALR